MMGRLLFFIVAAIAVLLAVVAIAPGIIPVAAYKDRIETAASEAVGRDVTIGDELSFRVFPRTAFRVSDLTIANEAGFEGDHLARVAEADIGVKLMPFIFARSVEVDRFVLTEPDIILARNANGDVNWNLAGGAPADTGNAGGGTQYRDIRLGDVRIVDGGARFIDATANKRYTAEDIDVRIILTGLSEPLEVNGTMIFQGAPSSVDIVLASLADLMNEEPSSLKLDVKIGETSAGADLTVETSDTIRYSGPVQLDAPDLPALAALTGTEIADAPGFDKLAFSGDIDGGAESFRLSNAQIDFDDIAAQGAMTLEWTGERPKASGVLSTEELDLRQYMPPPSQSAEGFPEWSEAPMDLTGLRNIDADFDISTNSILLNDLKFGESRLKLTVLNGRMTADIPELAMYGGQGSGRLVVNARGATPSFSGNFDMGAVQAEPLSLDLLKHDNLLGLGAFTFDFTANGASQAAIMSSLDGSGGFDIADGLVKGVNLSKIARAAAQLQQGFNPVALQNIVAAARGPAEETDFSEFLSEFTITDGLLNAPTISMNSQYLAMTGQGSINLPAQTIDLRLSPRATASLNDGETTRSISVPVRVGGTFSQPSVGVDGEALTRLLAGSVLQQVLGGGRQSGSAEGEGAEGEPAAPSPRGLIEGILSGGRNNDNDDPNSEQGANSESNASVEETLANDALNALFGSRPAASEETAEEEDPQQ